MIKKDVPIYIWGTGLAGFRTFFYCKENNINVAGFIDSNKDFWGKKKYDCTVFSPEEILQKKNIHITIAIYDDNIIKEISKCCKRMKVNFSVSKIVQEMKKQQSFFNKLLIFCKSFPVYLNYLLHNNDKFENNLSVVSFVKDEGEYLKEWIEYHLLVGVERFYIYDNESTDNTIDVLKPYIEKGIVVYEYAKGNKNGAKLQCKSFNKAVKKYRNKSKYMAFIDGDEFIVPVSKETIPQVLEEIKPKYGLGVHWIVYGYSGHFEKPKGLVIENYTKRTDSPIKVKVISNPRVLVGFNDNPHYPINIWNKLSRNENGKKISSNAMNPYKATENDVQKIRINHYITKSYKEYEKRLSRNRLGNPAYHYQIKQPPFEIRNEEDKSKWLENMMIKGYPDKYDYIMEKWVEKLKERKDF